MKAPIKVAEIQYKDYGICNVLVGDYYNGGKALMLSSYNGEPIATLTRYIKPLPENAVSLDINNCGHNVHKILIDANIIKEDVLEVIPSGYCDYPVYTFTDEVIEKLK